MELAHRPLSEAIIGAAITVHRELGPGFIEHVYENALSLELQARGIPMQRQVPVPVVYRGVEVGLHRLDLVVDALMVVELKAIKALDNVHFAVVRSYLNAIGLDHGLILNFAKTTLEIKRVGRQSRDGFPGFVGS
jgi:GxxExxY protein